MFAAFLRASRAVRQGGGRVAFECPRHCLGWKQWKVATTSKELIEELSGRKCKHEKGYLHAPSMSVTPTTALYPSAMCKAIVGAWYANGAFKKVASALPVEVDPVEQRWKKKPSPLYVSLDSENAKIPTRATSGSAGLNTYASGSVHSRRGVRCS